MRTLAAISLVILATSGPASGQDEPKARVRLPDVVDRAAPHPFAAPSDPTAPRPPRPTYASLPETVEVRVAGSVRDLDDGPIAGASVDLLGARPPAGPADPARWIVLGTAAADAGGVFRFSGAKAPVLHQAGSKDGATPYVEVIAVARAAGRGVGWHRPASMYAVEIVDPDDIRVRLPLDEPIVMDLHLRPEAAVTGRVVDEAGRPLVGAAVTADALTLRDEAGRETAVLLDLPDLPDQSGRALTDDAGRFRLAGLPTEATARLSIRPRGTAARWRLRASTTAPADVPGNPAEPPGVYPNDLAVTLPTTRPAILRIVGDDDGRPVAGVRVAPTVSRGLTTLDPPATPSDADGRLALDLPPGRYEGLAAEPPAGTRFRPTGLPPLVVAPESAAGPIEFRIKAGFELVLDVVDAATRRGVPDLRFEIRRDDGPEAPARWSPLLAPGKPIRAARTDAGGTARALLAPDPGPRHLVRILGSVRPDDPAASPPPPLTAWPAFRVVGDPERPFRRTPGTEVRVRFELRRD